MNPTPYGRFRLKTFLRETVRAFALLFTIGYGALEVTTFFFDGFDSFKVPAMASYIVLILIIALVRGLLAQRALRELRIAVGNEHEICIVVDDFMSNVRLFEDAACIFGVNDRFAVVGLKPDSAHAAFLKEYFPHNNDDQNQIEVDQVLMQPELIASAAHGGLPVSETDRPRHPLGTVACMPFGRKRDGSSRNAFLLVNSSRHRHGFSGDGSTASLIQRVWLYHREHKLVTEQIVFSLVGTGHAQDLTRMRSVFHIIDEYFGQLEQPSAEVVRIKRLVISMQPRTVMSGMVDLEVVHNYVKARSALHRVLS